ncbi:MAG: carbamoyl-phosphate synthase large subunit, partial [Lentisphaerae bacterium]
IGEAMSIGRTFKESFQKAFRSMEIGIYGFGANSKDEAWQDMTDEDLAAQIQRPSAIRFRLIGEAFRRGWTTDQIHKLTAIDPWFLREMEEIIAFASEIRARGSLEELKQDPALFRQAKEFGYSDRQIAYLTGCREDDVRQARYQLGLRPVYNLVDTCAAEFDAATPYYYSSYSSESEIRHSNKKKIMILGGGPNRIGQGIEFDYCCVHAAMALHDAGLESIMVNSNPETVSTDYDTSDKLYFEPLTLEDVLHIYEAEHCDGVIVQFGGQTPLNLARDLKRHGVNIIGTTPESIELAENREEFQKLANRLGILQPPNGLATNVEEAVEVAEKIGYPVLVRPSFVLGGRAMVIVYNEKYLRKYMEAAVAVSEERPVLIDRFLEKAVEVDVDCISDGETIVIGGIMEHVELAGVHSGDSACFLPPQTLSSEVIETIRRHTKALARELHVVGLMNVQYAIQDEQVYVLEVNPRASRTIPFVSKAIGVPLAKLGALVMAGHKLTDYGFTTEIVPKHICVKEAVFPFNRFPGTDIILSPEMKSTGEVMGIDSMPGLSYFKSQMAAGNNLPLSGNVFISLCDDDKEAALPLCKRLVELGFTLYATMGTSTFLRNHGVPTRAIFKISQGRPNVLDLIDEKDLNWIINTPTKGPAPMVDEIRMRGEAVIQGIPITTTIAAFKAAIQGIEALRDIDRMDVRPLQDYYRSVSIRL